MARRSGVVTAPLLVLLLAAGSDAAAQTREEHEEHHPGGGASSTATMPPTDMEGMMRQMQRMMGAPPGRPLLSRLLDAERLSESERNALRGDAERRVQRGLERLEQGAQALARARRSGSPPDLQRAVDTLKEAAAEWETGRAVVLALESPEPRAAALQWFKVQMNLAPPAVPPDGPWGVSWRHAALMVTLAAAALGAAGLHLYKVGRSLRLLARLGKSEDHS